MKLSLISKSVLGFITFFCLAGQAVPTQLATVESGGCLLRNEQLTCFGHRLVGAKEKKYSEKVLWVAAVWNQVILRTDQGLGILYTPPKGWGTGKIIPLPGPKPEQIPDHSVKVSESRICGQRLAGDNVCLEYRRDSLEEVGRIGTLAVYSDIRLMKEIDISYRDHCGVTTTGEAKCFRRDGFWTEEFKDLPIPALSLIPEAILISVQRRIADNHTEPTVVCVTYGKERKLYCVTENAEPIDFPAIQNVTWLDNPDLYSFCAIHGSNQRLTCWRSYPGSTEYPGYRVLEGGLPLTGVEAISPYHFPDTAKANNRQLCVASKADPEVSCWSFGDADEKYIREFGWRNEQLPTNHPLYPLTDFGKFLGEFGSATPNPLPPNPASRKPAAPSSPAPSGKTGFEDL